MEGAIKNIVIILLDFLAFAILLSAYIGYKTNNNYFGLGVFFFFLIVISYSTFCASSLLVRDFSKIAVAQVIPLMTSEQEKNIESVQKWIEWQKEINRQNNLKKSNKSKSCVPPRQPKV